MFRFDNIEKAVIEAIASRIADTITEDEIAEYVMDTLIDEEAIKDDAIELIVEMNFNEDDIAEKISEEIAEIIG